MQRKRLASLVPIADALLLLLLLLLPGAQKPPSPRPHALYFPRPPHRKAFPPASGGSPPSVPSPPSPSTTHFQGGGWRGARDRKRSDRLACAPKRANSKPKSSRPELLFALPPLSWLLPTPAQEGRRAWLQLRARGGRRGRRATFRPWRAPRSRGSFLGARSFASDRNGAQRPELQAWNEDGEIKTPFNGKGLKTLAQIQVR